MTIKVKFGSIRKKGHAKFKLVGSMRHCCNVILRSHAIMGSYGDTYTCESFMDIFSEALLTTGGNYNRITCSFETFSIEFLSTIANKLI